jgi:hypothetical protein
MGSTVRTLPVGLLLAVVSSAPIRGQTPQPFPRPGASAPTRPTPPAPTPSVAAQTAPAPTEPGAPSAREVWFPVYPAARYLQTFDAGRGQRYYIYGATAPFADVVAYYKSQLDERGTLVFKEPATHMFEIGRFKDDTMAFPPGVTVKDWTWGGSQGYLNPKPGDDPQRFPTVIMIVPPPPDDQR